MEVLPVTGNAAALESGLLLMMMVVVLARVGEALVIDRGSTAVAAV